MRLVLLGPPGSGKGTQAKLLAERNNLRHIATGDMLRQAIARDTPVGRLVKPYMDNGGLVPDNLVNDLVAELFRADRPECFVMDGYPRTLAQAVSFDQLLLQEYMKLEAVVRLVVDDEEVVRRLGGRWTCPNPTCGATYHIISRPPKVAGRCDRCDTALIQRPDDMDDTIRRRLQAYHAQTAGLVDYYRDQGLLCEVPGQGDVETIYQSITRLLCR